MPTYKLTLETHLEAKDEATAVAWFKVFYSGNYPKVKIVKVEEV